MKQKGVNRELQIKVKKYLEYALNEESAHYLGDNSIYSMLSETLKFELLNQIQGKVLKSNKLFVTTFSVELLRKTIEIMEERIYSPDDVISLVITNHYQVNPVGKQS